MTESERELEVETKDLAFACFIAGLVQRFTLANAGALRGELFREAERSCLDEARAKNFANEIMDKVALIALHQSYDSNDEDHSTEVDPKLFLLLDECRLSKRTASCLTDNNIFRIGDLVQKSESELLLIKTFGRRQLKMVHGVLASMNLRLNMKIDNWPQMLERWKQQHP